MKKQSNKEEHTAAQRCTLMTYGKALISVAHVITSVTSASKSSESVLSNVTRFGCQTVVVHGMDTFLTKWTKNDKK